MGVLMDDRIAEIREALGEVDRDAWGPTTAARLIAAARERLAELESDALIIRRDENGNWPLVLVEALEDYVDDPWTVQAVIERTLLNHGFISGSGTWMIE